MRLRPGGDQTNERQQTRLGGQYLLRVYPPDERHAGGDARRAARGCGEYPVHPARIQVEPF